MKHGAPSVHHVILSNAFFCATDMFSSLSGPSLGYVKSFGTCRHLRVKFCCSSADLTGAEQSVHPMELVLPFSLADSSDADRLERFFDSEDEDFEILSL